MPPKSSVWIALALALAGWPAHSSQPALPCPACPWMVEVPSPAGGTLLMTRGEITFDDWEICVAAGACEGDRNDHGWGRGSRPVINVTWHQAASYARWLSSASGLTCRLPSEAEWELAARGGAETAFWWGDAPKHGMANCRDCNPKPIYGSTPSGTFPANPFGLWDMNGNVWEWTADCWPDRAAAGTDGDACASRAIKGGSWYYFSRNMRPEARAGNRAETGSYNIGFRVACH